MNLLSARIQYKKTIESRFFRFVVFSVSGGEIAEGYKNLVCAGVKGLAALVC